MTHPVQDTPQPQANATQPQGRRRRFLGAGVSAAPLILTMVSQPALGATCFTPSRSLSRNTSLSQQDFFGECTGAESPGNYKRHQVSTHQAYHWPDSVLPTDPFHPTFDAGSSNNVTQFFKWVNGEKVSKSFGEVLQENAAGMVAFHIIGAYLNKKGGNGAVIPDTAITEDGIKAIWAEYASKGYYEPIAGVKWYATDIKRYLKDNGLVA